jgi:hypothetical protein
VDRIQNFLVLDIKAQKVTFGFKGLNAEITLMSLDNHVSAGIFWKENLTQK